MSRVTARPAVVVAVLLGTGLVVLAGGRGWVSRTITGVPGVVRVGASGTDLAPAATALALVAGAGAIALAITGPLARRVVAALVVLAGLGTAGLVAAVLADPAAALAPFVVTATGQSGPVAGGAVAVTGWPWAAIAGGMLTGLAGLVALLRSGSWASGGRRFEPGAGGGAGDGRQPPGQARAAAARRDRDLDTWDALSRGDDPTES